MNPKIIKLSHRLLFATMIIVGVTGLMKVFDIDGGITNDIHEIAGLTLIALFVIHMYIHRKMLIKLL